MVSLPSPPSPLVPVAVSVGLGVWLERAISLPWEMLLGLTGICLTSWLLLLRRPSSYSPVLLWISAGLLACMGHRLQTTWPANAIGHVATQDRTLVRLRATVAEDVNYHLPRRPELLSGQGTLGYSVFLVDTQELHSAGRWQQVTGKLRVTVEGEVTFLQIGDGVELLGGLHALSPPVNPGGIDFRQNWLDQDIQATLAIKSLEGVIRHAESDRWSVAASMAQGRAWVRKTLAAWLPARQAGIAQALLCGEQAALAPDQFESYLQTGVYHVLAVSGQHLVVLCAVVGFLLRFAGGDLRQRAIWMAVFVIGFTLLTGARPPVVRAAAIVLAWCLALWLRRRVNPLNALALAWIVVCLLHPSDLANTGCQLSFLAVFVLMQIIAPWYRWKQDHVDPLDRLEAELRPPGKQLLYWCLHGLWWMLLVSAVVWLATVPLVLQRFHIISPVAVLLGPLLAIPISVALVAGMLLVLLHFIPVVGTLLAWVTGLCLFTSDMLVNWGRALPGSFGFWPDVPDWWVTGFYVLFISVLLIPAVWRWWKWWLTLGLCWLLLVIPLSQPQIPARLRMTVLSVGHGTAVVIETPAGKCLVYDAGSLAGPDVAHRHLASYLWSRGRTKIDEVFLSHADLDHFNSLPDLVERFRVGTVRLTPSFAQRPDSGTQSTLQALERKAIPLVPITKGVILEDGELRIEALHPPALGPAGTENARSLLLLLCYQGKRILLTGDLEQPGLSMVMEQAMEPIDVLVSPHHGSRMSNTERFAAWCLPKLVISSETFPRGPKPDPYSPKGATLWRTWIHGGVVVEMDASRIRAETVLTGVKWQR
ncbi:MAG: ComEC/Rec2 family competence protein [Gemmatales bacterium]